MSKKVIIVRLDEIQGLMTGFNSDINLLLTASWSFPRANVKQVISVLDLGKVGSSGLNKTFNDDGLSKKLLFKEENEGESYLVVEISAVEDESQIGKIINAVLMAHIGTLSNPLVGAGLKAVVGALNLGEKDITTIAKGAVGLREHPSGAFKIPLKVPLNIDFPVEEDLWDSDEYDYEANSDATLIPKASNGELSLQFLAL